MLNLTDYQYDLPPHRIALYPLAQRDQSKLLVYDQGLINHETFSELTNFLPANSFLFFNNTKVIPARLHFKKDTGAEIEIFLLSPLAPSPVLSETMSAQGSCTWTCTVGNVKRWQQGTALVKSIGDILLEAMLLDKELGRVEFTWNADLSFAEIIRLSGETPLPPYLKREAEESDRERYQTIYSEHDGAVAAPTAGLHFTPAMFQQLKNKNLQHDFLTLHVSAGTFQPIKSDNVSAHTMHNEQVIVTRTNLENLLIEDRFIVPVGTTSMRTLESIYWYGVKLLQDNTAAFSISQDDPYNLSEHLPSPHEAVRTVLKMLEKEKKQFVVGQTSIFIKPGYTFKICHGLITNFHQPGSTLILLVAAFIGEDWKEVYKQALSNDYRFLSFGDSSLLIPK